MRCVASRTGGFSPRNEIYRVDRPLIRRFVPPSQPNSNSPELGIVIYRSRINPTSLGEGKSPSRDLPQHAHLRLPAPPIIRTARRCRPGCRRALVADRQALLPSIADARPRARGVAADAAEAVGEGRCDKCRSNKAECETGRSEGHLRLLLKFGRQTNVSVPISFPLRQHRCKSYRRNGAESS